MKKDEIRTALDALRKIKMPKIEDKDFRNLLIDLHYNLYKLGKKVDADIEALRAAHLASYEDDIAKMKGLPEPGTELFEAITGYDKALNALLAEDVEIPAIDGDKFVSEYRKQDYDASVVEGLFPLFDTESHED